MRLLNQLREPRTSPDTDSDFNISCPYLNNFIKLQLTLSLIQGMYQEQILPKASLLAWE